MQNADIEKYATLYDMKLEMAAVRNLSSVLGSNSSKQQTIRQYIMVFQPAAGGHVCKLRTQLQKLQIQKSRRLGTRVPVSFIRAAREPPHKNW